MKSCEGGTLLLAGTLCAGLSPCANAAQVPDANANRRTTKDLKPRPERRELDGVVHVKPDSYRTVENDHGGEKILVLTHAPALV